MIGKFDTNNCKKQKTLMMVLKSVFVYRKFLLKNIYETNNGKNMVNYLDLNYYIR